MKYQFTPPKQLKASMQDLKAGTTFVFDLTDGCAVFMILNKESVFKELNTSALDDDLVCYLNINTGNFYYRLFTGEFVYVVKPTIIPEFRTIDALNYEQGTN